MRKHAFCIYENKGADQLQGNRAADQHICFSYVDRTIPLLPKSEISTVKPSSVVAQPGLCRTWLETPKTGLLSLQLTYIRLLLFQWYEPSIVPLSECLKDTVNRVIPYWQDVIVPTIKVCS